ncbi:TRAP transporter substrate-binding protein [Oceaniglobus indicus]|uniref:TRAP transporter substrate-binding protein n=1 Tax=Oceaniglobus indicus TaxID=2047749 RepID=UPI000C1787D0|nr:TRAP transporter substrate-binding protein [Oceaniglobus indicus]
MFKLVMALAAGLAVAVPSVGAAQDRKLIRFGYSSPTDLENDNGATAWIFKQFVESRSDTLEVGLYGSSELGSDQDVLQAMQLGSGATMHIGGTALFNSFIERVGVLDLPFLWQDYAHVGRALDGDVGASLEADFEASGFKVLGWGYSWGYRNVVTGGAPINSPEGIKGLKLRTIQSPIYVAALNAMGANATPMAFGEVYTALQTGVLDGFEHAASMVYSSKLYEVTDNVALTRHLFGPTVLTYSLSQWEALTEKEQEVVQAGADFAIEVARALAPGREAAALDLLREQGMTITEIDTSGFAEAAVPLQDELAAGIDATDVLADIRAAAE